MGDAATMVAKDAVFGGLAECFITIDGRRYNFMSMTEFESKWKVNIKDVPILGQVGMGHKAAGGKGTWSGTAHYNQSVFRMMADKYQKTGEMPYFEMQVSNEDPTWAADHHPQGLPVRRVHLGEVQVRGGPAGRRAFWDIREL